MPGTNKSTWGFMPCDICPPKTLNNGTSGIQCETCDEDENSSSSVCFRGASHKIDRQRLADLDQVDAFPDSPDSTEFDDVLLNHVFKLVPGSDFRELAAVPIFWGILAIGLGLVLFTCIVLLGRFPNTAPRQTLIKRFFTHLDLVGEGELWVGGLVTLAIVVLVIFTCKFSVSFSSQYPIESLSGDAPLMNAKFSSSLKLLAIRQNEEEKPIFDLLDGQNITLTLEFISTGFQCGDVALRRNLARDQIRKMNYRDCSYENATDTLVVSSLLPQHLITVQSSLLGPFFVGGLRVCLSGPETAIANGKYTVQALNFCHFVYTPDQVLSIDSTAQIEMIKVINRTAPSSLNSDVGDRFSGIWLPTWSSDKSTLWDADIYTSSDQEYLRSLTWELKFIVEVKESRFYMINFQEPIARGYEIVFKTVLFSSKIISPSNSNARNWREQMIIERCPCLLSLL